MSPPPAIRPPPHRPTAAQRSQRKQDLLLASQLARGQVLIALDDLSDRADTLAVRVARVRLWLGSPVLWSAVGAVASVALGTRLRRTRVASLLRWGWLAWRLWRRAAPALALYRGQRAAPGPAADRP